MTQAVPGREPISPEELERAKAIIRRVEQAFQSTVADYRQMEQEGLVNLRHPLEVELAHLPQRELKMVR